MKKGLTFYVVGALTILSAGFCILTLKQSLVGASYYENEPTPTYYAQEIEPSVSPASADPSPLTPSPISSPVASPSSRVSSPIIVTNPTYPARLVIPSLSINAFVQQTGLTKTGAMGIPTNFTDVAWYRNGAVPGAVGNTVIDGHVDNALALPGVFKHLDEIKVGDDIYVKNKGGEEIHFVVTNVSSYNYEEVPTEEIFGKTTEPTLRLITCGGTWVQEHKTYDQRTVVTAKLAS